MVLTFHHKTGEFIGGVVVSKKAEFEEVKD